MTSAWLAVARREFLERVRSKWFVIVTLLGPVFMVGITVLPAVVAQHDSKKRTRVELIAHGDPRVAASVAEGLRQTDPLMEVAPIPEDTSEDELLARIRDRKIEGWLDLPANLLDGGKAVYHGANATNFTAMARMQAGLQQAAIRARAEGMGLGPAALAGLLRPIAFDATHTTGEKKATSGIASFVLGYLVMFALYMGIVLYAINVMRSVVLEKTSRVIEIVISSIRPAALMAGKIIGVGSVGLVQLCAWSVMAAAIAHFRGGIMGAFGVAGVGAVALPPVGVGTVLLLLAYFLLGYFLYAAMYAAIGAMCSSDQEAQQAQTPVIMLLIIPVLFVQLVANDPRGPAAVVLTLVPFSSPVLMPMRFLLGGASMGEVALSLGFLALAIAVVTWLAARIYRVGILMYGKRPGLRELGRWIRHA